VQMQMWLERERHTHTVSAIGAVHACLTPTAVACYMVNAVIE